MAKVKISCYADFYKFPWLRYRLSAPASGSDYLIQADYSPSKHTEMYLRFKYESRPVDNPDLPDNAILPEISEQETSGIRYHISYNPASNLVMQNRIELSFVERERGILVFQDIQYKLLEIPLHFDARLTWFNTGDYQTRIYAYEQDMRRGYSFTPLYDRGFRFYVMANYVLKQKMVIAAKFSNTLYGHRKTTGTGYDEVTSSSKSEIKIMLTIRL
jgi:hypothetical protein